MAPSHATAGCSQVFALFQEAALALATQQRARFERVEADMSTAAAEQRAIFALSARDLDTALQVAPPHSPPGELLCSCSPRAWRHPATA